MRTPAVAARSVAILGLPLLLTGAASGIFVAVAASGPRPAPPAASLPVSGRLYGVAAASARDAWAVGCTRCSAARPQTLIAHWNGRSWTRLPSRGGSLSAVAVTPAGHAWAVGATGSGRILILRWNGNAWQQAATPALAGHLSAVATTSAGSAWAVGYTAGRTGSKALALWWNGAAWKRVRSPGPGNSHLDGVAAVSARSAWAVGGTTGRGPGKTLVLRWTGAAWKRVPSPTPPRSKSTPLAGVTIASARGAWAVGCSRCATGSSGNLLIQRWNGIVWQPVRVPAGAAMAGPSGVTAISATTAWAVGFSGGATTRRTMILRWNGTAWQPVPSPSPGPVAALYGVAAVSAGSAWAVGSYGGARPRPLILRWNGTSWKPAAGAVYVTRKVARSQARDNNGATKIIRPATGDHGRLR